MLALVSDMMVNNGMISDTMVSDGIEASDLMLSSGDLEMEMLKIFE